MSRRPDGLLPPSYVAQQGSAPRRGALRGLRLRQQQEWAASGLLEGLDVEHAADCRRPWPYTHEYEWQGWDDSGASLGLLRCRACGAELALVDDEPAEVTLARQAGPPPVEPDDRPRRGPRPMADPAEIEAMRQELQAAGRPAGERSIARKLGVSRDAVRYALGKDRRHKG